jgi:hypothetical protein
MLDSDRFWLKKNVYLNFIPDINKLYEIALMEESWRKK